MSQTDEDRLHLLIRKSDAISLRVTAKKVEEGDQKKTRVDCFVNRVDENCRLVTDDGGQTMIWLDMECNGWPELEQMQGSIKALLSEAVDFWVRETPR